MVSGGVDPCDFEGYEGPCGPASRFVNAGVQLVRFTKSTRAFYEELLWDMKRTKLADMVYLEKWRRGLVLPGTFTKYGAAILPSRSINSMRKTYYEGDFVYHRAGGGGRDLHKWGVMMQICDRTSSPHWIAEERETHLSTWLNSTWPKLRFFKRDVYGW